MKRFLKLAVNFMAIAMLALCCLSFAGCEEIKTVEITLQVYDYEDKVESEKVLTVRLYRHLAPKTVDAITSYVFDGFYDDMLVYQLSGYTSQLMIGDYKFDGTNLTKVASKPTVDGEFERNGVTGSDLVNASGYIGLWRSWYEMDGESSGYKTSSDAMDSGRNTIYIPTTSIANYNDYFCVFGRIEDLDDTTSDNYKTMAALKEAFGSSDNYTEYVVYYTGVYDASKADKDYGLKFNSMTKEAYDELTDDQKEDLGVFEAEGEQLVCYNKTTVRVPNNTEDGKVGVKIISAKLK